MSGEPHNVVRLGCGGSMTFYQSKQWQKCRREFLKSKGGLCERCLQRGIMKPASVVHHINYIDPEEKDPSVSMNWNNLEALCRDCHEYEHGRNKKRYKVDEYGRVTTL